MTQLTFVKNENGNFETTFTSTGETLLQMRANGDMPMLYVYVRIDDSLPWCKSTTSVIPTQFLATLDIPKDVKVKLVVSAKSVKEAYIK